MLPGSRSIEKENCDWYDFILLDLWLHENILFILNCIDRLNWNQIPKMSSHFWKKKEKLRFSENSVGKGHNSRVNLTK